MSVDQEPGAARMLVASILVGACAFFLAVQVCGRVVVGANSSFCIQGGPATQNVLFLISFVGTTWLVAWSLCARRLRSFVALGTSAALLGLVAVSAHVLGESVSDLLKFYVSYFGCIGVVASGGLVLLLAARRQTIGLQKRHSWTAWWGVGATSLGVGLLLYQTHPESFLGFLMRVVTVLIVPPICLMATAVYYRGKYAVPCRIVAAVGVFLATMVASIR